MKRKGWYLPMSLAVLLLCTAATEAPEPTTETYMKGGNYYIEKTYTLKNGEDIDHLLGASFELNGYTYHQIDVKSEPVVEVLTKEVSQTAETTVTSESSGQVAANLGETKTYEDEDGYKGELKLDHASIQYAATGYTTKTYTKSDSKMYYGLSSMDTSQIAKNIWSGGVSMTLYDIQWIGDNNMGSGDTAVGNNYNAKALYSGTYSVKIPTAYIAKVTYTGTAEKEISEQTAYTLTYLGEKAEMQVMEEENHYLPFFIGGGCVLLLLAGGTIYYLLKRRKIETVPSDLDGLEEGNEIEDTPEFEEKGEEHETI